MMGVGLRYVLAVALIAPMLPVRSAAQDLALAFVELEDRLKKGQGAFAIDATDQVTGGWELRATPATLELLRRQVIYVSPRNGSHEQPTLTDALGTAGRSQRRASSIGAQERARPFVEGAIFLDYDGAGGGSGEFNWTLGAAADVGLSISDRDILVFGAEVPSWHEGRDLGGAVRSHVEIYTVLWGRRYLRSRPVQIELFAGGFVARSVEQRLEPPLFFLPAEIREWFGGPHVGIGVPVTLTSRVTLVPALRLLRPRIALRWAF